MPTQEELKHLFNYNPEDGRLYWKNPPHTPWLTGKPAGALHKPCKHQRYTRYQIRLNGKTYLAHRLIWIMHFGPIAAGKQIDHKDRRATNNRLDNLRLVTMRENFASLVGNYNRIIPSNNTSGHIGVHWQNNKNRWIAQITFRQKKYLLGYFTNKEDAINARHQAELSFSAV